MTTWSHDFDSSIDLEDTSVQTTKVLGHLNGVLDETMLAALSGVWSTLEHAATNPSAHARAVRSRLFWQTLEPGGEAAAPITVPMAFEEPHEELAFDGADAAGEPDIDDAIAA